MNGPNINLLGHREVAVYGSLSYTQLNEQMYQLAKELEIRIQIEQSNHEGGLIDILQACDCDGIVVNAGAYTHTSIALRDAFLAMQIPFVEVHLSNTAARESFRKHSYLADVAIGQIAGFGADSYLLGLRAMCSYLRKIT